MPRGGPLNNSRLPVNGERTKSESQSPLAKPDRPRKTRRRWQSAACATGTARLGWKAESFRASGEPMRSKPPSTTPNGRFAGFAARAKRWRSSNCRHGVSVEFADVADLARLVARDAPHQGVVIEVEPLDDMLLADVLSGDPHAADRGARSGDRSAQCRRNLPVGGCVRCRCHRHAGPACPARIGHGRQGRIRRARNRALGARGESVARARRDGRVPATGASGWMAMQAIRLSRRWAPGHSRW